ncbi:MAG TPA: hypothetical protein VHE83_03545 [Mycobacteriales bacterium]|nr:hypothetical protein [Mycobacteriales bacterium]
MTVTNANPAIVKLIRILGLDTELNLQEPGTAPPPPSAALDEL